MKTNKLKIVIGLFVLSIISGCYPEGYETYEETDIVITDYNMEYNFSGINTYYMPDTIHYIGDDDPDREWDSFIIDEIEKGFLGVGYTRINDYDPLNLPDVIVTVSALENESTNIYSYPYYGYGWGSYYPYYGYGWGYPYYPYSGYGYAVSYSIGTVFWNLWDPTNVDTASETIPIEYTAIINGLMGSSQSTSESRITDAVNKAFIQSPYL